MSVQFFYLARLVALLAEGVDRNRNSCTSRLLTVVALLAEGVDRNHVGAVFLPGSFGRPPRGGRG